MDRHAPTERRKDSPETTMTNTDVRSTENAAAVAEQGAYVEPNKISSKKGARPNKSAHKGQKSAKGKAPTANKKSKAGKKAKSTSDKTGAPRAQSKGAKILELIGRPKGASLAEIMKTTTWQAHSVRGFLSTAAKKHGLKVESTKTGTGDRVYQIRK
jgi:hypothetical protein